MQVNTTLGHNEPTQLPYAGLSDKSCILDFDNDTLASPNEVQKDIIPSIQHPASVNHPSGKGITTSSDNLCASLGIPMLSQLRSQKSSSGSWYQKRLARLSSTQDSSTASGNNPAVRDGQKLIELFNTKPLTVDISHKFGSTGKNSSGNTKSRLLAGDFDVSLEDSIHLSQGFDKTSSRPPAEIAIYTYLHQSGINPVDVGAFLHDSRNQLLSKSSNNSSAGIATSSGPLSLLSATDDQRFADIQIAQRTKHTLELSATPCKRKFNTDLRVSEDNGSESD